MGVTAVGGGSTGTPGEDPRLAAWERRTRPLIILAALAPIVVALGTPKGTEPLLWLDLVSWLVFLVDLVVHIRWRPGFLRTFAGRFDLAIVLITFPWYVIPGLGNTRVLGIARVSRVARLLMASRSSRMLRRLMDRLGQAGAYALALMVVCAAIVENVEPASSGFATFGDAFWWAIVTFTTVGYGDLYPVTTAGRTAAIFLMVGGVALIGVLAGSMSELFTGDSDDAGGTEGPADADVTGYAGVDGAAPPDADLWAEVRGLREEIAALRADLSAAGSPPPPAPPPDAGTAP
jgi:voltage-gated potassium channel